MFSEVISAILALLSMAIPLFFPEQTPSFYAIWIISVFALYLISLCVRLAVKNKRLKKELDDVTEAKRTLQKGFDEKRELLALYRAGFISLEHMLAATMQTSKNDRFNTLYQWFLGFRLKMKDDER